MTTSTPDTHNQMTRVQFLRRVLESGELTRVAQHLAMVIIVLADSDGCLEASVRDLERVTGWSKSRIADHLQELRMFSIRLGSGRTKSVFALQGMIEDALAQAVIVGSRPTRSVQDGVQPADAAAVCVPDSVRGLDAAASVSVQPADAGVCVPNSVQPTDAGGGGSVQPADAAAFASNPRTQKLSTTDTTPTLRIYKERARTHDLESYSSSKIDSLVCVGGGVGEDGLGAPTPSAHAQALRVSDATIEGPGFRIDLGAVDMAASLSGMPRERARTIAEIVCRDWVANRVKPSNPMAMIRAALTSDANRQAVHATRLGRGGPGRQPPDEEARRRLDAQLAAARRSMGIA